MKIYLTACRGYVFVLFLYAKMIFWKIASSAWALQVIMMPIHFIWSAALSAFVAPADLAHEAKQDRMTRPRIRPSYPAIFADGVGDIASNNDSGDQITVLFVIDDIRSLPPYYSPMLDFC